MLKLGIGLFKPRTFSKSAIFLNKEAQESFAYDVDVDLESMIEEKEAAIEASRNKSRLNPAHKRMLNGIVPYDEPVATGHLTLRYKRKIFARYGSQTGLDPGTLWPTKEEMRLKLEYENVAHPYSIQELQKIELEKKENEYNKILENEKRITQNIAKLQMWKKEIKDRAEKKMVDIAKAKAKKDALIEEVRREFGFKVDPRDEKFKELLLKKEKENAKKAKAERLKEKQAKLFAKILKTEKPE